MPRQSPGEPPPYHVDERSVGGLQQSPGRRDKDWVHLRNQDVDCSPQMAPVTIHDRELEDNYNWPSRHRAFSVNTVSNFSLL